MTIEELHDSGVDHRLLQEYLSGRDVPCPTCRYNLRDLMACACPECGDALRLQVGTTSLRVGLLLLLIAPLLVMVGIGVVFGLVAATDGLPRGWGFYAIEITALLDLAACLAIYRTRNHIMRIGRIAKAALVLGMWTIQVSVLVVSLAFGR